MLRQLRYSEWLTAQDVLYNFDKEIPALANNRSKGIQNDTPPVETWHLILPTIRLAEKLRGKFGSVRVNSAYRSEAYNKAVGGAKASQHYKNTANDLRAAKGTPKEWAAYLRELREAGEFKGGIGIYNTFIHVDTRGTNVDWE